MKVSLRRYLGMKQPARITRKRRKHAKQIEAVKQAIARVSENHWSDNPLDNWDYGRGDLDWRRQYL